MILFLLLLSVVPFVSYNFANKYYSKKIWMITLASFGIVVCPLSFGVYGLGFIPYVGLIFALIAGLFFFSHLPVGYAIAIALGIQEPRVVVSGVDHLWINIINSIVWGIVYGVVGFLIDLKNSRKAKSHQNLGDIILK